MGPGDVSAAQDGAEPEPHQNATTHTHEAARHDDPGSAGGQEESDDEDDMPDYSSLASLLAKVSKSSGGGPQSAEAFIPKRGEKDFEPTGFTGQAKALQSSRSIMYQALSGRRTIAAKNLSDAVFDPSTMLATANSTKGTVFATMGVTVREPVPHQPGETVKLAPDGRPYPKLAAFTKLFAEEVLFLMERGALECKIRQEVAGRDEPSMAPLSLQQAFAVMLSPRGCSREQYQTYAYLRRLGYIVQRTDVTDGLRRAASLQRLSAPVPGSAWLRSAAGHARNATVALGRCLRFPLSLVARAFAIGIRFMRGLWTRSYSTRVSSIGLQLGLHGAHSYDDVFASLRFIPTCDVSTSSRRDSQAALQPCFYAWRPATAFKKTDPPLPEFRIAACAAKDVDFPSLMQFGELFDAVPLPDAESLQEAERQRAAEQAARNNAAYGRQKTVPTRPKLSMTHTSSETRATGPMQLFAAWSSLFAHCMPGPDVSDASGPARARAPAGNLYSALKGGRRNIILAVVDEGTTSLLRFGESDFEAWKLAG